MRNLTPAEAHQLRALGKAMAQQAALTRFITDAERAELFALYAEAKALTPRR